MAKYELLIQNGWPTTSYVKGEIYDTKTDCNLSAYVARSPRDWQLIDERIIIGYKLKDNLWENDFRKQSFLQGVCKIGLISGDVSIQNINECTTSKSQTVIDNFKKAGVLDLWFDPIFEKEFPDITINGYKGEFLDKCVKFGCAEISKQVLIDLFQINNSIRNGETSIGRDTNRSIESVTIGKGTFTKDQIKQIAEYYLNKYKFK